MKINYDPEADALYIELLKDPAVDNIDISEDVSVDLTKERKVAGIEILNASLYLKNELFHFELMQSPRKSTLV